MTTLHSILRTGKAKGEPGRRTVKMSAETFETVARLRRGLPDGRIACCDGEGCNTLVGVGTSELFLTVDGRMLRRAVATPHCPKCGRTIWSRRTGR